MELFLPDAVCSNVLIEHRVESRAASIRSPKSREPQFALK